MANPVLDIEATEAGALPAVFHRYRSAIDDALRRAIDSDGLTLYQMLRYSMGWSDQDGNPTNNGGKGLRPTLCLYACEATGGNLQDAMPAAVSLEFIHNFSLIHDDIQDRDETRHHRPTLWTIWGDSKALEAGNALRIVADMFLWQYPGDRLSFDDGLTVAGLLTEAYLDMIEGQYLDLSFEGRPDIGLPDYLAMISRKTGALIRCSLVLGALIGARDEDAVSAFRECGRALGFVFQIRDDMLGVWGDEEATGKPVGADIRRRKNTLPVVYAMSRAQGKDRQLLQDVYSQTVVADAEVASVLEVMERLGTREYAQSLAEQHCEDAIQSLYRLELSPEAQRDVEDIARFLLVREH